MTSVAYNTRVSKQDLNRTNFKKTSSLLLLDSSIINFFSPFQQGSLRSSALSPLKIAMKPGGTSLNPYAASYIPLSKREACDRTEPTTKDSNSSNENVWYANPGHLTQNQHCSKVSLDSIAQGAQKVPIPEGATMKSHPVHGSYGSSSKQLMDEEFDMDLEYLRMSFPGLSDQSLTDVYLANKGDLEATIDMLTQLEFDTVESSENLPDTLDIGDVSESGSASECGSMKLKTAVGEASASSSGPSGSAIVS